MVTRRVRDGGARRWRRRARRSWPYLALLLGITVLAVFGLTNRGKPPAAAVVPPTRIIAGSGFPSPIPSPSASAALEDGTRVKIPALGIDLQVVPGDGWNAPMFKAATYPGLGVPGQGARSMIYAHAQPGMFLKLWSAHVGETVEVDRPGQPPLHYEIKEFYRYWPALDLKYIQPSNHEELVLLTCTTYNPNDPRVIAVAEPV